jgi:hypothetical protein
MSQAYVNQSYDKNPKAIPPYADAEIKTDNNSEEIKRAFMGICS